MNKKEFTKAYPELAKLMVGQSEYDILIADITELENAVSNSATAAIMPSAEEIGKAIISQGIAVISSYKEEIMAGIEAIPGFEEWKEKIEEIMEMDEEDREIFLMEKEVERKKKAKEKKGETKGKSMLSTMGLDFLLKKRKED
jgi:precorrin-3B methylase